MWKLNIASKAELPAGEAVTEQLKARKLSGITADAEKAKESIKWVAKLSKLPNCKEILATHDSEVAPYLIEL